MIELMVIKNFKKYVDETIYFDRNNILIGENDSGKSSVLEALDIFFNDDKIPLDFVIDENKDVVIGIKVNGEMHLKKYVLKTKKQEQQLQICNDINYIHISNENQDINKILENFASTLVVPNISEQIDNINQVMSDSMDSVLGYITDEIMVFDNEHNLNFETDLRINNAIKFKISSGDGVPLTGRGSGFRKNILYALMTKGNYENTIIGVDEIENSLSPNNVESLLEAFKVNFRQTVITTHSPTVLQKQSGFKIIPRYLENNETLSELMIALGSRGKKFLVVEGITDVSWFNYALDILENEEYIVLPGGGSSINQLSEILSENGFEVITIQDGDTDGENKISKECIELYTPLSAINEILNTELTNLEYNKVSFFETLRLETNKNDDTIKRKISNDVNSFLTEESEFVQEVKALLNL